MYFFPISPRSIQSPSSHHRRKRSLFLHTDLLGGKSVPRHLVLSAPEAVTPQQPRLTPPPGGKDEAPPRAMKDPPLRLLSPIHPSWETIPNKGQVPRRHPKGWAKTPPLPARSPHLHGGAEAVLSPRSRGTARAVGRRIRQGLVGLGSPPRRSPAPPQLLLPEEGEVATGGMLHSGTSRRPSCKTKAQG